MIWLGRDTDVKYKFLSIRVDEIYGNYNHRFNRRLFFAKDCRIKKTENFKSFLSFNILRIIVFRNFTKETRFAFLKKSYSCRAATLEGILIPDA